MEKKNKRKRIVIDKRFQYRLVATFLVSILGALLIFSMVSVVFYWAFSTIGDNVFKEYITIDKQVFENRTVEENGEKKTIRFPTTKTIHGIRRWEIVIPALLLNNLLVMIVLTIIGIFYSHRIAGPVYRMNRVISDVLSGKTEERVVLRKNDTLSELAENINILIDRVESVKDDGGTIDDDL